MEKKYPIGDMVMPAEKVSFIKEAIQKLKASNKSDYESGEFDVFNHKQEGRYGAFEEVLQWLNPATPQGIGWVAGEYDSLYDQLKAEPERKIVCWVNYEWGLRGQRKELLRDICSIMGRVMGFNARGIGYGGSEIMIGWDDERKYFLEECARLNVQWLDETGGEKEVKP